MNKEGKVFDTSGAIIKARKEFISLHNYFYSISIPFNDIFYIILRVINHKYVVSNIAIDYYKYVSCKTISEYCV